MLGKTHVLGGTVASLALFCGMQKYGMLIEGVPELLQLGVILPYGIWTSTLPDYDQDKESRAEANPINLLIQKFFRILGTPHRGFASHVAPVLITLVVLKVFCNTSSIGGALLTLIMQGCFAGLFSHLVLDMFNGSGVTKYHLRFVPHNPAFNTDTPYELVWRRMLYVVALGLLCIVLGQAIVG